MTLTHALAALRALPLPTPRIQYLAARMVSDPQRAGVILSAAADEAERVRREGDAVLRVELAQRAAYEARQALKPSQSGYHAGRAGGRSYVVAEFSSPPERPVRVTYTTPRKPAIVRPEHRPEMSEGYERNVGEREKVPHGLARYQGGCRCDVCRLAKKESRESKGMRAPNGTLPEHGNPSRYTHHQCRCDLCRAAIAKVATAPIQTQVRNSRPEISNSIPTAREVQRQARAFT